METFVLFDHQEKLLQANPPRHLLAWGTGTGKTATALALAQYNCHRYMIICPKTLKENWRREVLRWTDISVAVFNPKKPVFTEQILIISKEEFKKFWAVMPTYEGVIVDEAHTFAGIKSQLYKNLMKYLFKHHVKFRWLLTATPYLRNAWNIFALGKLLGQPWEYIAFRYKFFYERFMSTQTFWDARPGMEDDIAALVASIGSTVKLEDCIDIPEATFETEYFKLTPAQNAAMKKVKELLPVTRFTKYHQICGGTLKGNEYEPTVTIESDKVKRVIELVQENPKIIISCRYLAEMEMLEMEIAAHDDLLSIRKLNGDTENKQDVIDEFNSRDRAVLIVNAACSEGWQAPSSQLIVFYSYDFSLKNKIQMEGRIRRIDRPQKVTYIALVCEKSIDELVVGALSRKMDFDAAIYDYELNH